MSGGTSWNTTGHFYHINVSDALAIRKSSLRVACSSFWVGLLLTVLVTFVVLSTPKQRSGIVFFIQCISFSLALVYNCEELAVYFSRIRLQFDHNDKPIGWQVWNNAHVADISLEHIVPIIADSAVIFKINSFFPTPIYSTKTRILVISPLVILIIPRIVVTALATYYTRKIENDVKWLPTSPFPLILGFPWTARARHYFQAEFGLGAGYAFYASVVLLIKAAQFASNSVQQDRNRLRRRLRFFAEAILMTFIPPFLFSITAAGVLDCPPDRYCYYREMAGSLLNISVLFSLLATSWSSIRTTYEQTNNKEENNNKFAPYDSAEIQPRGVLAFFQAEPRDYSANYGQQTTLAGSNRGTMSGPHRFVGRHKSNTESEGRSSMTLHAQPKGSQDTLALNRMIPLTSVERDEANSSPSMWRQTQK